MSHPQRVNNVAGTLPSAEVKCAPRFCTAVLVVFLLFVVPPPRVLCSLLLLICWASAVAVAIEGREGLVRIILGALDLLLELATVFAMSVAVHDSKLKSNSTLFRGTSAAHTTTPIAKKTPQPPVNSAQASDASVASTPFAPALGLCGTAAVLSASSPSLVVPQGVLALPLWADRDPTGDDSDNDETDSEDDEDNGDENERADKEDTLVALIAPELAAVTLADSVDVENPLKYCSTPIVNSTAAVEVSTEPVRRHKLHIVRVCKAASTQATSGTRSTGDPQAVTATKEDAKST
eukprot:m51a1_g9568 hypothetical protein (293) ;mRNA; r:918052-919167